MAHVQGKTEAKAQHAKQYAGWICFIVAVSLQHRQSIIIIKQTKIRFVVINLLNSQKINCAVRPVKQSKAVFACAAH